MAGIFAWSTSAGSNTTIGGVSVAEGMSPALVNNAIRQVAAEVAVSFSDSALETFFNGSAPLPVAKGGTGGATASAALSALGALSTTYRDLPVTAQTGAFSFSDSMRGTVQRYSGAAASLTIPANATTAINTGGVIVVYNRGSGSLTTTKAVGVSVRIAGLSTDADVTIAANGYATFIKTDTNEWVVVGSGVS